MGHLSLGNCGSCWDNPCTCGKQSYSDTSLSFLRTDELLTLKAKIEDILAKRSQSVSYAANTTEKVINRSHHHVVNMDGQPFNTLSVKHKD